MQFNKSTDCVCMFVGKYYRMDHDQYEDTVTNECLQGGDDPSLQPGEEYDSLGTSSGASLMNEGGMKSSGGTIYDSQASYNPFDIHMGQMTVYRLHITCSCSESDSETPPLNSDTNKKKSSRDNIKSQRQCARILPARDQPWSAYMGTHADSYFPRKSHSSFDSSSSVPPSSSLRDSFKTSSTTQTSQLS